MLENIELYPNGAHGAFSQTYQIYDNLNQEQRDKLIEWLSVTLSDNFILLEINHRTIAGGCSDNYDAWGGADILKKWLAPGPSGRLGFTMAMLLFLKWFGRKIFNPC